MRTKRILLIRSQDILTDTRVQRYEKWYKENSMQYYILGWDREDKGIKRENTDYCTIQAGYNLGTKGIKYRIKWNIYVVKYLLKRRNTYNIIHACDFDTVMPSLIMKLLGKKVIFDIFDWFSDEVKTDKRMIDWTINALEKLAVRSSDVTILCEEERIRQIGFEPKRYIVIPNIPQIECNNEKYVPVKGIIRIAYVGGFYPDRGLEELVTCIQRFPHIELHLAGFGDKSIEGKIKEASKLCTNIRYYGKVDYKEATRIMESCDLMYGMYYKINRNNIFAAPNKFYEALFLEKPIITTKGTLVGQRVDKYGTGFVIAEGKVELEKLLNDITPHIIQEKEAHIKQVSEIFKDRWQQCMGQYKMWINKL